MTPDEPLSKSESVYRQLRERIITGVLPVGERLILGQVAKEYGVSPVPVREAIRRLEAERLVTFTQNVGAEVASIDIRSYAEVVQTVAVLEAAATALAAPHMSELQIRQAESINDEMRALLEQEFVDGHDFIRLNKAFHGLLLESCPNEYLAKMVATEQERVVMTRRNAFVFEASHASISVADHDRIVSLIRDEAPASEIEQAVRDHKLRRRRIFVHLSDDPAAAEAVPGVQE